MKEITKFLKSKDIHLFDIGREKLSVTNGVEINHYNKDIGYFRSSFIPKHSWNEIDTEMYNFILSNEKNSCSLKNIVDVLNLELLLKPYLIEFHHSLIRNKYIDNLSQVEKFVDSKEFNILTGEINNFIIDELHKNVKRKFLAVNEVNQITTTVDYADSKKKVGLHLDNWCKYDFKNRKESPTRICINLGNESRYLLLYNLSVLEMYSLLSKNAKKKLTHVSSEIGNFFMKENSNYPILRIEILPFEGYVAPTEMIIHDGSTIGQSFIDLCLHYIIDN